MLLRITILLLLTCSTNCLYAQDYAVNLKGDTLRGKIRIESIDNNHRVIVVGLEKKRTSLTILQTKAVHIDGDKFEPVLLANRYVFMKLVQEGYLSLYNFQMEKQQAYNGSYLLKKDRQGLELPNLGFKRAMGKFLAECPIVTQQIEGGILGRNDITKIIEEFNKCIIANSIAKTSQPSIPTIAPDTSKLTAWIALEEKITSSTLESKADLLEMVTEIKNKISKGEKVPKFLLDGLRNGLQESGDLVTILNKAIGSM